MNERHTPTDRRTDREPNPTDADASSGWREEYRHQDAHGADPHDADPPGGGRQFETRACKWPAPRRQLVADGGPQARRLPTVGERVTDREAADAGEAVITAVHPDTPAAEAYVEAIEKKVADVNPGYDPAVAVADVAFRDDLEAASVAVGTLLEDVQALEDLAIAVQRGDTTTYTYPVPRLKRVEADADGGHTRELRETPPQGTGGDRRV